jgi:hypothetical protein
MHPYIEIKKQGGKGEIKKLKQRGIEAEGLIRPMQELEAHKRSPLGGEKLQAAAGKNGDELGHWRHHCTAASFNTR